MNTFGITNKSYNLLLETLSKYREVEQAVLFGSRAKGNFKNGSDIDIAIKGKNCTAEIALNINAIINEDLPIPYYVDIVNYNSLQHDELKKHIDRVGVTFFQSRNIN
ncbi:MAG TPA: nucleotidyltransferase domain-containing protein [Arachidicoccus soli]|uniref:Nucleotidyltransferase domain-containing protein n=1 Tax=Arachidicoccus soli TaxID=2341117 RepID=A0A386HKB3_9BACT|nr:nucleotidyltransferase domain-containing protein [Arachidicoccus soli]AYD46318.1 nucleotidyltransferase domain-containing protein [Arachidicoccus soli]HEU0227288.1 nucleotidyltransferase domain-containing protein [Arachidicoccus soli]